MEQQIVHTDHTDEGVYLQHLKAQIKDLQDDVRRVVDAVKSDYEIAKKAIANLKAKSELKAYVQSKLKPAPAMKSKMTANAGTEKRATVTEFAKKSAN
jgi:hypothetical protein